MSEPDSDMLAHYSAALAEIYRLRIALGHEATVFEAALGYRTLPEGLREQFQRSVESMRAAVRGEEFTYTRMLGPEAQKMVLRLAGAPTSLTRSQWEASR